MNPHLIGAGNLTGVERDFIGQFLASNLEELVAFRRRMHMRPELSGEERDVTEALASRLLVTGLEPHVLARGTGVVCDVGDPSDGRPVVALRADIDALAMNDECGAPYRSTIPGVAHSCGHDVHTAIVLGAGLLVDRYFEQYGNSLGTVRLIFEPSEEIVPGGAVDVIREGYLEGASAIFGLHCDPKIDVGLVGLTSGPIASAADHIEIDLSGPGGHTARPERTVDLVNVASRVVTEVPRLLAERTVQSPLRLVFGSMRAGDAPNVIPAAARLGGTLRTKDRHTWKQAPELLEAALAEVIGPTGAQWTMKHRRGVPPVVNDNAVAETYRQAVVNMLGEDSLLDTDQSWGGDTFAWYLEKIPGAFARLGTHDPASDRPRGDLHASSFDVDESSIGYGVQIMTAAAISWLRTQAQSAGPATPLRAI